MFGSIKRFWCGQKGNVGIIFALAAVPAFALMGGVVDYSRVQNERHKIQAALDAGVLAALKDGTRTEQDAKNRVWEYFNNNYKPSGRVEYDLNALTVRVNGGGTNNTSSVTATMVAKVHTSFLGLLGLSKMTLKITSQAVGGGTVVEVALVIDASYSMTCNASGFDPSIDEPTYTKRVQARQAVDQFIADLKAKVDSTPGLRMKLALVPYSTYVRLPGFDHGASSGAIPYWVRLSGIGPSNWRGYVGPRDPSANLDATDSQYASSPVPGVPPRYKEDSSTTHEIGDLLPSIKPLKDLSSQANVDALRLHARSMISEGPAYIPGGIAWGWRVLSRREPFTQGGAGRVRKVMIILAGGSNLCEYDHDGLMKCYSAADTTHADERMRAICDAAKRDGIDIIGISYYPHPSENLPALLQYCQNQGLYHAGNKTELINVFSDIADHLSGVSSRSIYLSH